MRTLRLSLVGTVVLALLGGLGGVAIAQSEDGSSDEVEPYAAVSGLVGTSGKIGTEETEVGTALPEVHATGYDWWLSVTTDDPRLTGRMLTTQNFDLIYEDDLSSGTLRSGRGRLSNDGGSWVAEFHGFTKPGTHVYTGNHYVTYLTGEGGYEGLSAMYFMLPSGQGAWTLDGVIFPGPLPEAPSELPAVE